MDRWREEAGGRGWLHPPLHTAHGEELLECCEHRACQGTPGGRTHAPFRASRVREARYIQDGAIQFRTGGAEFHVTAGEGVRSESAGLGFLLGPTAVVSTTYDVLGCEREKRGDTRPSTCRLDRRLRRRPSDRFDGLSRGRLIRPSRSECPASSFLRPRS